jgi:hypothetical protein
MTTDEAVAAIEAGKVLRSKSLLRGNTEFVKGPGHASSPFSMLYLHCADGSWRPVDVDAGASIRHRADSHDQTFELSDTPAPEGLTYPYSGVRR